jgi:hypothetical protein
MQTMTKTMNPKELAAAFGLEGTAGAKLTRSFLRSKFSGLAAEAPGKGGRWSIPATAKDLKALKAKFAKFEAHRAEEIAARNALKGTETPEDEAPAPEVTDNAPEGDEVTED